MLYRSFHFFFTKLCSSKYTNDGVTVVKGVLVTELEIRLLKPHGLYFVENFYSDCITLITDNIVSAFCARRCIVGKYLAATVTFVNYISGEYFDNIGTHCRCVD